jgi:hypothetical protein
VPDDRIGSPHQVAARYRRYLDPLARCDAPTLCAVADPVAEAQRGLEPLPVTGSLATVDRALAPHPPAGSPTGHDTWRVLR